MNDFLALAREHRARYPLMQPRDFCKLAYQSEFGPAHMLRDPDAALPALLEEVPQAPAGPGDPVPIGNGLCRFPLSRTLSPAAAGLLARLFALTADMYRGRGSKDGLEKKLDALSTLEIPGWEAALAEYRAQGCPPVSHSGVYREAYAPHYRLLHQSFAGYFPALTALAELAGTPAVAAVDGRCGSGKSGFAALAARVIPCQVVHMDDFYLPRSRRPEGWMDSPAGNMDLERLREEVLLPARDGRLSAYVPYDCQSERPRPEVKLAGCPLTVVEGTYSQFPGLAEFYDCKIFFTCGREVQTRRLRVREGDYYPTFDRVWRALEERYFAACGTQDRADLVVDTTGFFD